MASPAQQTSLTPEEYLAIERGLETKHEFYRGEMFAMSGASREHNLIGLATGSSIYEQLKNRRCESYVNDMRVNISPTGLYTYPDVVITCEEPRFEDEHVDTLLNPQAIIEVLSKTTQEYDRGKKFEHYRQIESLQDYLLISQDRPHVELFSRQAGGGWLLTEATGLDDQIEIPSVECTLKLSDVYAKIDFSKK